MISPLCTIVDDGTIPGRRGSITIDDEGVPSQNTVLIEKGVLKNYIQDRHNARLMGMQPTGNGRRESYAHLPIPRMTNTYMLPGESDPAGDYRFSKTRHLCGRFCRRASRYRFWKICVYHQ